MRPKNKEFNIKKYTILFLIFNLISLILVTCSKSPNDPETVTFSGTVALEGETDHSGVKVSLYNPVELDTALVRINQQYPNIGVQISQETEFDHREHSAIYSTTTNAAGAWEIKDVTPGTYNVIAEKDSFGWKYELEKNNTDINFGIMLKAFYLSGYINSTISLSNNQFVIISNDVTFQSNSNFNLSGNNTILLSPQKKITILGGFDISSLNRLNVTSRDINNLGRGIIINTDGQFIFDNLIISYLTQGILFETNNNLFGKIKNSIFKNCTIVGVYAKNDSISVENCIFNDFDSYVIECLNNFNIKKNIFLSSKGVFLFESSGLIADNYFYSNSIAITPYKGNISIINNEFKNNKVSIAVNSSDCEIKLNNFLNNSVDIDLNKNYVQASYDYSNPNINSNNFIQSDTAITVWGEHSLYAGVSNGVGINQDLEVLNCFWVYTNSFSIDQLIIDANDDDQFRQFLHYIIYSPFELSSVQGAGIH